MSLHTSEAPISVYIGTRGLQSLPVPSPLSPSDRAETPEFSSLDIDDEKATKAEGDLCHEHKRLLARWGEERSGIWNAAAMQQTETAVIVSPSLTFICYRYPIHSCIFQVAFCHLHGNPPYTSRRTEHP